MIIKQENEKKLLIHFFRLPKQKQRHLQSIIFVVGFYDYFSNYENLKFKCHFCCWKY